MNGRRKEFYDRKEQIAKQPVLVQRDLRIPWKNSLEKVIAPHPIEQKEVQDFSYCREAVENLIDAYHKGYIQITNIEGDAFTVEYVPIQDIDPVIGHIATPAVYAENINKSVWGSEDVQKNKPTYLQTTSFGVEGGLEAHVAYYQSSEIIRLYIDTSLLRSVRDIFLDPECIDVTPEEYPHAFMVFGGIPREAIIRGERTRVMTRDELGARDSVMEFPTHEETHKEMEESEEKLRTFLREIQK